MVLSRDQRVVHISSAGKYNAINLGTSGSAHVYDPVMKGVEP